MEAVVQAGQEMGRERAVRALRWLLDVSLALLAISLSCGIAPIQISLAVALLSTAALEALGQRVVRPTVVGAPLFLLLAALVFAAEAAPGHSASLLGPDAWGLYRMCAAVVLVGAVGDARHASRLAILFVIAAAAQGVYGVVQYHTGIDLLSPFHRSLIEPVPGVVDRFLVRGTLFRPSTYAFVSSAALAFMMAALLAGAIRGRGEYAVAALAAPVAAGVLYTFYGTMVTAFVAGLLAMAVVGRQLLRAASLLAALGIGATLLLTLSPPLRDELFAHLPPALMLPGSESWVRILSFLSHHAATGIGARNLGAYPSNNLLLLWVQSGPVAVLAFFWMVSTIVGTLRRAAKEARPGAEGAPVRALVLGAAGVLGSLLAWTTTESPTMDGVVTYAFTFCISLGLAAAGTAASIDPLDGVPADPATPPPRITALLAAGGLGIAALWGSLSGHTSAAQGRAALALLAALALAHAPHVPRTLARRARGIFTFLGAAVLAARPFSSQEAPGSPAWWATPAAAVSVLALVAGVAAAVHAVQRPGRVGPAMVAGALTAVWVLLFTAPLEFLHLLPEGAGPRGGSLFSYNFAAAAFAVGLLFSAYSGPMAFGEARPDGVVGRVVSFLPVAVALGLLLSAAAGFM